MTRAFVLFESFIEAIDQLPPDRQWPFLKEIVAYRLDGQEPSFSSPLERMAFTVMKPSIDASAERYNKAVEEGQKGGRPKKWIDREDAEEAYERLKNWDAVARNLDVSRETLRKARIKWEEQDKASHAKKPKNPTKTITKTENKTVTKTESYSQEISNNKEKRVAAPPPAPKGAAAPLPLMPGYEFDRPDGWYRINEEGRAVKIADKPK